MRLILTALIGALFLATPAFAAGGGGDPAVIGMWGLSFFLAFFGAFLALKCGQATVVGALIIGVGVAYFKQWIHFPHGLALMSTIGMAVLLFEAGLESDLKEMKKELKNSITVAITGVVLPGIAGALFAIYWMKSSSIAEIGTFAVALTATSVGISLQVLEQLKLKDTSEARIIIGAAVLDDILGMAALAALGGIAASGALSFMGFAQPVVIGLGFIGGFILIGGWFNRTVKGDERSFMIVSAVSTLALALAGYLGIATIIATFVAGAVLKADHDFEGLVKSLGKLIYAPAFFAVGLLMDWSVMSAEIVPAILALSAAAFITKLAAGFVLPGHLNRWLVGCAMASRGEVGLAVIAIAKANNWISGEGFAVLTGTVILVTVLAPITMKMAAKNMKTS